MIKGVNKFSIWGNIVSKFNLVDVNGTCLRPYLNSAFNRLCKNSDLIYTHALDQTITLKKIRRKYLFEKSINA